MEFLKATNLSKIYQTGESAVYALDDVTLSIDEGSFVAITGPSGSGKSTLLHLLSGLDKPTKGVVTYRDKDLYQYNDNQLSVLRRRRFGFVFQSYNLVKELTGYENMLLPVMLDNKKPDEKYLNRIIEMLGIGDRLSHLPGAMSGGQQQRLCIARALAVEPDILLMDEPTSALDPISTSKIEDLAEELKEKYTIVMVTHNMQQAARVSDDTAFFLVGEMVEFNDTKTIFSYPRDKRTEDYITGRFG